MTFHFSSRIDVKSRWCDFCFIDTPQKRQITT